MIESNIEGKFSSRLWGISYIETNKLIREINTVLKEELENLDLNAKTVPPTHNFDKEKLVSSWSHRHVGFVAGLGKFGLNNMLITEKGCCGRMGSIVTDLKTETTERTEKEYCLYKRNGTCKECIDSCVNGSLSVDEFNRSGCYDLCLSNNERLSISGKAEVCGKCLVGVPCSFHNPIKE